MARQLVSAAEALAWEETLGRSRPKPISRAEAERSIIIPSFTMSGVDDGVFLRLAGPNGATVDFFLNAAVAVQMINKLCEIGHVARWRNEDDGSLIVRDPENLVYAGPKS